MIVPHVILIPKRFHKLQQGPTVHSLLQVQENIVATGQAVVGLHSLVAAHHVCPMPRNPRVEPGVS